ncbi:MAG: ferredoxin oxidoreductase [Thermocladium sp.]
MSSTAILRGAPRKEMGPTRVALTGNYAAAYAAKMADIDLVAIYPITPQTTIAEKLSEFVANGELSAELIHVESEHSALSATIGGAAVGARAFTATSSQGLELMHEILHIAAGLRLPIVMAVPSRALSAPISIHNDNMDIMNARETGWIMLNASNAQEVFDMIIQAFKIAEDQRVLLPVMVTYDGFVVSHTVEGVELPDKDEVLSFIPKGKWHTLDPAKPASMGPIAGPDWYYEIKFSQYKAMRDSIKVIAEVMDSFGRKFGREYSPVMGYMMGDAEYAIVSYGVTWGFVRAAVDRARSMGIRAGAVKLNVIRPFPAEEIHSYLNGLKAFAVVDRAIYYGAPSPGPIYTDVVSTLFMRGTTKPALNVIHGIGQRTMYINDFLNIYKDLTKLDESKVVFMGVRE